MAHNDPQAGIACIGLSLIGLAQMLARPDKTIHLLRGGGWYDDQIPATWHADQAFADKVAREHNARRANARTEP